MFQIAYRIKTKINKARDNLYYANLGKGSRIIKPMRIKGKRRISIGNNVRIMNFCRLETIRCWEDEIYNGRLEIGDSTSIEQCCHIVAAKEVSIGKECVISAFVYISDCEHSYVPSNPILGSKLNTKSVKIGNHCFIGIGSYIMPGVTMGNHVVIGANTVVVSDIPDYCMAVGSPAKIIKRWNKDKQEYENV